MKIRPEVSSLRPQVNKLDSLINCQKILLSKNQLLHKLVVKKFVGKKNESAKNLDFSQIELRVSLTAKKL